jgi:steroid 5-alpha reductase family enzyme
LLTVLVTVWGLRLSGYLIWRNLGKPEDFRYREMRARAPRWFWLVSLFQVFLLQGALMWVISAPVVVTQLGGGAVYWLDYLGIALWAVGLFFESVGDIQLARFKSHPGSKGKVMDRGLWRYTRHPNYFGDFAVWWGYFLIAAAGGAWWTVFSPIVMSVLLLRVSGVAMLERTISKRRPDYEEYARRTNAFFPGPPKRV